MGPVIHGGATTTETLRRAIHTRHERVRAAAKRYGISPTPVQKWRSRPTGTDARMEPKGPHSTVLSLEHEAVIVAFRRHTLLPLDDRLFALQPSI
ncbi:IS481 family transposase, partial [Methylobacterium sp. J-001]|nr:IS481 family transposase [Methylobacterium sp. J-001]